jgi:hypothetical protein
MASNKARDGRLSPRAIAMWPVIMTPAVSASQSPNISQTQWKQRADSNTLDAPLAHIPHGRQDLAARPEVHRGRFPAVVLDLELDLLTFIE